MINKAAIKSILEDTSKGLTEDLASQAKNITEQYFGRTISLYTPLYLSNYCSSNCVYCGFNSHNKIKRYKLSKEQMHREMSFVAEKGIENILLLTGESYKLTPLSYLIDAVKIAQKYFSSITIEVHPMQEDEYRELFLSGVDGVTVYQETYDMKRYKQVHKGGIKTDYDFRYLAPKRAAQGGMRYISLGVLLGLGDVASDLASLYKHLSSLEKDFPGVEYSLSFPRLRSIKGKDFAVSSIDDATFIKIICLSRITFPRVGINLSTRETPKLRDRAIEFGVTRISAGSNTAVGGYTIKESSEQEPQFDIQDSRSVDEIISLLKKRNFDPILTDWRTINNE
jgi:2-iminoacetate synthase